MTGRVFSRFSSDCAAQPLRRPSSWPKARRTVYHPELSLRCSTEGGAARRGNRPFAVQHVDGRNSMQDYRTIRGGVALVRALAGGLALLGSAPAQAASPFTFDMVRSVSLPRLVRQTLMLM